MANIIWGKFSEKVISGDVVNVVFTDRNGETTIISTPPNKFAAEKMAASLNQLITGKKRGK
jgi:hypothetical protein